MTTTVRLDDPDLAAVTLELEDRRMLGGRSTAPDDLQDRISLGRPACVPLDLAAVDPEAKIFLAGHPGSTFWLLGLTCSFREVDSEPMQEAWLQVTLRTTRPVGAAEPVAWSMQPLVLEDSVEVSRTAGLDASLKLTGEGIPVEAGPSMSRERTEKRTAREPYVLAHREGTARPSWIFKQTVSTAIRGVHRLRMVVELPAGAQAEAEVSAGATLRMKLLGLIPYRANLDELPSHRRISFGSLAQVE